MNAGSSTSVIITTRPSGVSTQGRERSRSALCRSQSGKSSARASAKGLMDATGERGAACAGAEPLGASILGDVVRSVAPPPACLARPAWRTVSQLR